ncbi:MAG: hypothetical protein ACRCUE_03925 [Bosea sp. (in: a-proteobacteria)]
MRFLIKLKLIALIAIWSMVCLGLYGAVAVGEAMLEIGAGAAGAIVGQGNSASKLADLTGDIVQWGIGLVWLAGAVALWFIKNALTSGATRTATGGITAKSATKTVPHVVNTNPPVRAPTADNGAAARILSELMARKSRKP